MSKGELVGSLALTGVEEIDRVPPQVIVKWNHIREYRTRLIADVVTGKLDVREVAARLPDEVDEPESFDEMGTSGAEEPLDEELETNV